MAVQAKMRCNENSADEHGGHTVRLWCVYDDNPEHPNWEWSQATPSGDCRLYITNPGAFERFEVGREYLVTFDEVALAE